MIKSVTVTNFLGESLTMGIGSPDKSGLLITNIEGIGPGNANVNTTEVSTMDGSIYNSARMPERVITITIKYDFVPTIEEARHKSYRYFPIKKPVTLTFETDNRTSKIEGYVESNEPDIFQEEEITTISIKCPSPWFESEFYQSTSFSNVEPNFEFPFSNESLTEPLIEMSKIVINNEKLITYAGDVETGVVIRIHAIGEAKQITLYRIDTKESMKIDTDKLATMTGSGIKISDDIIVSTIKGSKSITLIRDGVETNILNCLDKNADWFQLSLGDNIIAYTAEEGSLNLQLEVLNPILYEGV